METFQRNPQNRRLEISPERVLEIGIVLTTDPELLDEPFEGLMPIMVLKLINEMGVSVLIVEQRVKTALEVSQHILLMETV